MENSYGMRFFGMKTNSSLSHGVHNYTSSSSSESEEDSAKGLADFNLNTKPLNQNKCKFNLHKFSTNKILPLSVVQKIEKDLDLDDAASLVFLLYEEHVALNVILTILSAGPYNFSKDLFFKWAHTNQPNWCMLLIEALSVIQNSKILNNLGYKKKEIDEHFYPRKNVTRHLNKVKKTLYLLCEFLTKDQANELVDRVRRDAKFHNDITKKFDSKHLEFHILFWISRGYISINKEICLGNLTKHLKHMDMLDKVEEIANIVKLVNSEKNKATFNSQIDENEAYPIKDPSNVGLCIIVNMAQFKANIERRKELKHLLPEKPLDDREGSLMDVKNLKDTFTYLRFTVVEIHNVLHYHLETKIQSIIRENFKKNVHSVLVLCILSHGDKGVVYAVNSIPVKIQNIQNIISGPTPIEDILANIPKVILIQACQGQNPLFVEPNEDVKGEVSFQQFNRLNFDGSQSCLDSSELIFDGPQHFSPKYADVLTCLAIIEGFVAVRSIKEGTKYVQEFCKCLREFYQRDHLLDIVTRVHNNLNSKEMHVATGVKGQWNCREHADCLCIYMTPEAKHTLRKKLYLTPVTRT